LYLSVWPKLDMNGSGKTNNVQIESTVESKRRNNVRDSNLECGDKGET